ncbi:uncharacterized protein LOC143887713 isoform X2 [Tasmannia lanceolata]|uniref:uncharacterized protein LOC143887713 isoform X2 n=1 Tax=Tasmannia lanceolata TaxID=3420 RepID=UPI004064B757
MGLSENLPFRVGQLAEAKSFDPGFRGAWFRSKIKSTRINRGQIGYSLEFFDFPDEKISWTQLYQKPPTNRANSQEQKKRHMMLRPSYPPIYQESEMPDLCKTSEVIAVVGGPWKVGDLVDWWFDGCYWAGNVIQLLGNDKIELPAPPLGEGKSYEASCKDIRPSLDWSLEHGWSVPKSKGTRTCGSVRLIQPWPQENDYRKRNSESTVNREETQTPNTITNSDPKDIGERKSNCSDKPSSSHDKVTVTSTATNDMSRKGQYNVTDSSKKIRISGNPHATSIPSSDTIESSVLGLEELANKINWLKGVLKFGIQGSNAANSSWKFL